MTKKPKVYEPEQADRIKERKERIEAVPIKRRADNKKRLDEINFKNEIDRLMSEFSYE